MFIVGNQFLNHIYIFRKYKLLHDFFFKIEKCFILKYLIFIFMFTNYLLNFNIFIPFFVDINK